MIKYVLFVMRVETPTITIIVSTAVLVGVLLPLSSEHAHLVIFKWTLFFCGEACGRFHFQASHPLFIRHVKTFVVLFSFLSVNSSNVISWRVVINIQSLLFSVFLVLLRRQRRRSTPSRWTPSRWTLSSGSGLNSERADRQKSQPRLCSRRKWTMSE